MKIFSVTSVTTVLLGSILLTTAPIAVAEPLHRNHHRHAVVHTHRANDPVVVVRSQPARSITALSLNRLPTGYVRFIHEDETFYFSDGVYYQKRPHGFVVVKPRAGFRIASLPRGYTVFREGNATYYRYNNVSYRKHDGFFIVV